ncbi:Protein of unknown function [Paenibacillus sp. UNCCL117]|uniref:DUF3243 domain-containing protein n=1 Tax=unclassified Paenibacillus TaxID=185978 RepID=UPI00088BC107|nr:MULTISPECIES: DUF3243 domain-containing protein [unclassified Paenibacillus]SDC15839.1 Protein of unknown function [Paenibacillus sp. cl123]SFW17633.1 Protein of unknown function [Paenibacillus sp. UNCCL117]
MTELNHLLDKDGTLQPDKLEETMQRLDEGKKEEILRNFDSFIGYLGRRIELAEKLGLNEEQLNALALKVASYLANHEEPRNSEEKLLKELWKVSSKEEQQVLSRALVNLARHTNN